MTGEFQKFRYKNMTLEQLLIVLSEKVDQTLVTVTEMRDEMAEIREKKADKTEFTSYEIRLTQVDTRIEKLEKFRVWLLGASAGMGIFSSILTGLIIYIIAHE